MSRVKALALKDLKDLIKKEQKEKLANAISRKEAAKKEKERIASNRIFPTDQAFKDLLIKKEK